VDGREITAEPTEAPQTKIIDLMDALKASLAKRGTSTAEKKPVRVAAAKSAEGEPAARPRKKASGAR
jgi:non-homologous end joining protein Ku